MRVALLLLIPIAGCLDASTGNVPNVPAPTVSTGEVALRRVFSTGLTAPSGDRKSGAARSFARGRVELKLRRDSTLEYHLNVYNPGGDNFTAFKDGTAEQVGGYDVDALYDYFKANSPITAAAGNRIARIN